jgi:ornithine cyclodeaminase
VIVLDEAEVERRLRAVDLVALMRETLCAAVCGDGESPVRAALTTPDGVWFAAMPAWTGAMRREAGSARRAIGAKLVVAVPWNAERGLPTHRAVVVLIDSQTGDFTAWVEAEALTRARTAAVSVVATQVLARAPGGAHAILGAGAQGHAHLDAFAGAATIRSLAVWSRTRRHAEALAHAASALRIDTRVANDPVDAVRGADVVTTCTASAEPLFDATAVKDGAHVNAVGACVGHKRELPAQLVGEAALVVDDLDAAHAEAGDIVLAVADGAASWDGVVSLGAVLAGHGSPRAGRVTVFESLGLGIEDVAAAAAIVPA